MAVLQCSNCGKRIPYQAEKAGKGCADCTVGVFTIKATGDETVDHPQHYGGANNLYEAIKVIEAWDLDFALGNAVKYISRAGKKPGSHFLEDLKKARWYLDRAISNNEGK